MLAVKIGVALVLLGSLAACCLAPAPRRPHAAVARWLVGAGVAAYLFAVSACLVDWEGEVALGGLGVGVELLLAACWVLRAGDDGGGDGGGRGPDVPGPDDPDPSAFDWEAFHRAGRRPAAPVA